MDKILASLVDAKVALLKIIGGEVDIEYGLASLENYSQYKEIEAAGNLRTHLIPSTRGSEITLILNLNEKDRAKRAVSQNGGDQFFQESVTDK